MIDYDATDWDGGLEPIPDPDGAFVMAVRRKLFRGNVDTAKLFVPMSEVELVIRAVLAEQRRT